MHRLQSCRRGAGRMCRCARSVRWDTPPTAWLEYTNEDTRRSQAHMRNVQGTQGHAPPCCPTGNVSHGNPARPQARRCTLSCLPCSLQSEPRITQRDNSYLLLPSCCRFMSADEHGQARRRRVMKLARARLKGAMHSMPGVRHAVSEYVSRLSCSSLRAARHRPCIRPAPARERAARACTLRCVCVTHTHM